MCFTVGCKGIQDPLLPEIREHGDCKAPYLTVSYMSVVSTHQSLRNVKVRSASLS
jgi:hypothetical protein